MPSLLGLQGLSSSSRAPLSSQIGAASFVHVHVHVHVVPGRCSCIRACLSVPARVSERACGCQPRDLEISRSAPQGSCGGDSRTPLRRLRPQVGWAVLRPGRLLPAFRCELDLLMANGDGGHGFALSYAPPRYPLRALIH